MFTNDEELNITNDWIERFDKEDKEYSLFYKEKIETLSINFIYISRDRHIESISNTNIYLCDSILTKESLIEIIKKNRTKNKIKYKPVSILKYHINLEPDDVTDYLLNIKNDEEISKLEVINKIDDIYFEESISIMRDLICMYILFLENDNDNKQYHSNHKEQKKYNHSTNHTSINDTYQQYDNEKSNNQQLDNNKNIKKVTFNLTKKIIKPNIPDNYSNYNDLYSNNNNLNKTRRIYK
jgi:hypothetical protein